VNLVINNAGVALHQTVLETPLEDYEWIVGINFWCVVYGTKAFLPDLIASGDGHLVNVSSLCGLIAVPENSGYGATKFAVRGFTESLRQEMLTAGHPVSGSCVHPGVVNTNIARAARVPGGDAARRAELAESVERIAFTSPESAARTILRGIERDRPRIAMLVDAADVRGHNPSFSETGSPRCRSTRASTPMRFPALDALGQLRPPGSVPAPPGDASADRIGVSLHRLATGNV
jgi:short-subunit dehydrogenase